MTDKNIEMLQQAIGDYLKWIKSMHYKRPHAGMSYSLVLSDFFSFVRQKGIAWKDIFTLHTLKEFRNYTSCKNPSYALIGLSGYLFRNGRIPQPLVIPDYQIDLPDIYENYLVYHEQSYQVPYSQVKRIRRVLASFHGYLERHNINFSALSIEHLDAFMEEFNERFAPGTCKTYRFHLRGFLKYLYQERGILRRDLAPLVVGAPLFAQIKPPKFLRPHELQTLFITLTLSTPTDIRTYAMVHLAYYLGLRPKEISSLILDDISFSKAELSLRDRKNNNPIALPIPEHTIKAIAAYLLRVRLKSQYRHLFLTLQRPYRPISSATVIHYIAKAMKEAGLHSSAYWLRHTYAQNLLLTGASIYEIKEMLGHDNIQSTKRYLHIHTELMRKVLFDETL
ncbi:MAG: tyrosine-type recombinase/integrase [Desulfobacteraceae bacterium]|nr:tyrosine-type recombinase/integrase [Desulfobacteraceae bacterium]